MNFIYFSGILSLVIQVISGIIGFYSIKLPIPPSYYLINELVIFEIIVQAIEVIFYIWMISQFSSITNITPFRYYDWALTTPTMLTASERLQVVEQSSMVPVPWLRIAQISTSPSDAVFPSCVLLLLSNHSLQCLNQMMSVCGTVSKLHFQAL